VDKEKPKRAPLVTLDQCLQIAASVIMLDLLTGCHIQHAVQRYVAWAERIWLGNGDVVPPAAMVTALHDEARRITKEAARGESAG
jgi:hypothetical protein